MVDLYHAVIKKGFGVLLTGQKPPSFTNSFPVLTSFSYLSVFPEIYYGYCCSYKALVEKNLILIFLNQPFVNNPEGTFSIYWKDKQ